MITARSPGAFSTAFVGAPVRLGRARNFAPLLYRERQLTFEPTGFCEWGAKPDIAEFRN